MHTDSCMCMAFWIPRNTLKLFKTPYGHLIPQLFSLSFLVSLFCPVSHLLRQHDVQQLPVIVFNKYLPPSLPRGCLQWEDCGSGQIKTALQVRSFREPLDRSDNDSSLGLGFWRITSPIQLPSMAARLLVSTVTVDCWFSNLPHC